MSSITFFNATFLARLARVLAIAALFSSSLALAAPPALQARKISDNTWFFEGTAALGSVANRNFISNAAFVVTREGVVVIDALGSPALAREMIREIGRITRKPIRFVLVTHYHADHIYGLQEFRKIGATIIAHQASTDYLNSDLARRRLEDSRQLLFPWVDESTVLIAADRWMQGLKETIRLGEMEFQLHHVGPAHTPEDLIVWVPQSGLLFAGDLVFRGRIPFVGQADSKQWIKSLGTALALQPRLIVPGHGPVSNEPVKDLELTRDYLEYLRSSMASAARNLEPFDEAYAKIDWSRYEKLPLFRAANRMNAYNTYLLLEREQ